MDGQDGQDEEAGDEMTSASKDFREPSHRIADNDRYGMLPAEDLLLDRSATLRSAFERMNRAARGVLLLQHPDGSFERTVTDGDLRRLLLEGHSLDGTLAALPRLESVTVRPEASPAAVAALLDARKVDQAPVVDEAGRVRGIWLRRELPRPILLSTPHLSHYEEEFVEQAFRSNWIAPLGPNVDAFEREMAERLGVAHAAALSSGTAAIHLGLRLLGVGPGDVVFCSSLTFVASANPILYQGAEPVFIDSEPQSWNMSPIALERAFRHAEREGRLPRAVIVVGLYGQSADLDPIRRVCREFGTPILEDAAESLGATYKGRAAGTFGTLGAFSFNGNKIITTSGGGLLVSDDGALIEQARFLATQARDPAPHYQHSLVGFNYRMSNILAGVGRGQLRVLEERIEARRNIYARYAAALGPELGFTFMPEPSWSRSTRWLTACTIDPRRAGMTRGELVERLAGERIEARAVWKPLHLQPLFADRRYHPHEAERSVSNELFEQGLCLPSGSNLAPIEQERVIETIRGILRAPAARRAG